MLVVVLAGLAGWKLPFVASPWAALVVVLVLSGAKVLITRLHAL